MFIYKKIITIAQPADKVFEYIITPSNFPFWLKDVWIAGKTIGKMGLGCSIIQTIRIVNPRKFNMHVTGFVENRYFKIEAFKGFIFLPAFSFSFKPVGKYNHTELTVYASINLKAESNSELKPRDLQFCYPLGVKTHWEIYLQLLMANIKRTEEEKMYRHPKLPRKRRSEYKLLVKK